MKSPKRDSGIIPPGIISSKFITCLNIIFYYFINHYFMQNSFAKKIPEKYTEQLEKAWKGILPNFFPQCIKQSPIENGTCVNMFRMLPKNIKTEDGKQTNCELFLISNNDTEFWDTTVKTVPNYEELMTMYNHSKHILIGVTIPITDKNDKIIGNIRLFERKTEYGKPVCLL